MLTSSSDKIESHFPALDSVASLLTGERKVLTFIYSHAPTRTNTHTNKYNELNKEITMAHFPSQLKGKITRFP